MAPKIHLTSITFSQMPESGVTSIGRSQAIESQGISRTHHLDLIDALDQFLVFQLPWSGYPRPPCIQGSGTNMLIVVSVMSNMHGTVKDIFGRAR